MELFLFHDLKSMMLTVVTMLLTVEQARKFAKEDMKAAIDQLEAKMLATSNSNDPQAVDSKKTPTDIPQQASSKRRPRRSYKKERVLSENHWFP